MRKLAHSTELWKTFCSWPQRQTFSNCRRPLEERNWEECTKKKKSHNLKIEHVSVILGRILLRPSLSAFPLGWRWFIFRERGGFLRADEEEKILLFPSVSSALQKLMFVAGCLNTLILPLCFLVPITDTVFRVRGACWQVWLMMCWKAIKWRKGMTNLWWQKQSEYSVSDPLSSASFTNPDGRKKGGKEMEKDHGFRKGIKDKKDQRLMLVCSLLFKIPVRHTVWHVATTVCLLGLYCSAGTLGACQLLSIKHGHNNTALQLLRQKGAILIFHQRPFSSILIILI